MKSRLFLFCIISLIIWSTNAGLNDRLDCYLEVDFKVNQPSCEERGCIWDSQKRPDGVPICYLDPNKVGYKIVNEVQTATGLDVDLKLKDTAKSTFKREQQIENLKLEVIYITDQILRFKVLDSKTARYEVPVQKDFPLLQNGVQKTLESERLYSFELSKSKDDFSFSITRKSTQTKLFDTSIGGLIYSDQFLQIATKVPTKNIFGIGENFHHSLRRNMSNYETLALFSQDLILTDQEQVNEYGVHPFYTCLESDGKAHGILFLNSNAMEYTLLPEPGLSIKSVGGVLDFFVFIGENPENVIQLYTSLIGRPVMPPFWGLGFQLTRWGFKNADEVETVINRNVMAGVPLDVMYVDIDYMNKYRDFTYDPNNFAKLPQLINNTKSKYNFHWTLILDPGIEALNDSNTPFADGYQKEVFIKWDKTVPKDKRWNPPNAPTDKDVFYGHVWPEGPVGYPDFFKNVTQEWWKKWIGHLHNDLGLKFDALWIDMNEPSNLNQVYTCPQNKYDFPELRISPTYARSGQKSLSHNTICMLTRQGQNDEYLHYNVHSLYGLTETIATQKAIHEVTGKRGFTVSRSTYVSSGRYGNHWLGDNTSKWSHMKRSIIGILEMNFFGIPFVGPDICGFADNTTPELCKRWSALGAFYPFSRNHNSEGNIDQDPAVWIGRGHPEVTEAAKNSLKLRYQLLPYLYTLFFKAHTEGQTVARPLFHEFPTDNNTFGIDEQFLLGPALLFSPFLYPNQTEVKAYLPNDVWYDFNDLKKVHKTGYVSLPDNELIVPPLHFRGGHIIPISLENKSVLNFNTESMRKEAIGLAVFPGADKTASGDFFWDDGDSIETIEKNEYNFYSFDLHKNCSLDINVEKSGYDSQKILERIEIYAKITDGGDIIATLNGKPIESYVDRKTRESLEVNCSIDIRVIDSGYPTKQLLETINIFNVNDDKVEATLDGKPVNSVVKDGSLGVIVNIDLNSKKPGNKWTLKWKSTKTNDCNIE